MGVSPKSFHHQQVPPSPGAEEPWPLQPQVYSQRCPEERVLGLSVHTSPLLLLSQAAQSTVQIKNTRASKSTSSRELWPLKPPGSVGQDGRDGLITVQHQRPMGTLHATGCILVLQHTSSSWALVTLEEGFCPVSTCQRSPPLLAGPGSSADNHSGSATKMSMGDIARG